MREPENVLVGDSALARPATILESFDSDAAYRPVAGAPRTILHAPFMRSSGTSHSGNRSRWTGCAASRRPIPCTHPMASPPPNDVERESWDQLRQRLLAASKQAASAAADAGRGRLDCEPVCLPRPGLRPRIMTVREQLESPGALNGYHFGRIALLGQLQGLWPPPSGGFRW